MNKYIKCNFGGYRCVTSSIVDVRRLKVNFQRPVCPRCVLAALRTPKLGRTKVGNEAKSLKYSEKKKSCISYQFRADVKTYGHLPRHTSGNDASEIDMCVPNCQVAAASVVCVIQSSTESTGDE